MRCKSIKAQATYWREGEVGHNVQLEEKMRDTSRSQIISTEIQEIAEQTAWGSKVMRQSGFRLIGFHLGQKR